MLEKFESASQIERQLLEIYSEVRGKWDERASELFNGQCGFSILGSQPSFEPELLIIGENPGFGADDVGKGPHLEARWPEGSYLEGEDWTLKKRLRELFYKAELEAVIGGVVLTNFLFFKSSSLSRGTPLRWSNLPKPLRDELQGFCAERVSRIVEILQPRTIMVLGMSAFDRYAQRVKSELYAGDGKRRLIASGSLFGIEAFSVMHPTGARWSEEDRTRASTWLRGRYYGYGADDL